MECKHADNKTNKKNENIHVAELLKSYNPADLAVTIVRKWKPNEFKNDMQTFRKLEQDEIADLITPASSQFRLFEETYMEYRNYKRQRLSTSRNYGTKPEGITNANTTFGITEGRKDGVFEVVFQEGPNYCHKFHGLRKSEWTNNSPPLDVTKTYGIKSAVRSEEYDECPPITSSGISFLKLEQKTVRDRQHAPLERSKFKGTMPCTMPLNYTFGQIKPAERCSVAALLGERNREELRVQYLEIFSALNELRLQSKKGNIQLRDIRNYLREKLNSKYCTFEALRDELLRFGIKIHVSKVRTIGTFFKCVDDLGNVDYVLLLKYMDPNLEYPKIERNKVTSVEKDKLTTYREMASKVFKPDPIRNVEPAGAQLSLFPKLPPEYCKADLINLPSETTVRACLSPSIPTVFGLSHRDFFALRNKDDVRRIIQPVFNLSEDAFDRTWEVAKKQWLAFSDLVSIEAFLYALKM